MENKTEGFLAMISFPSLDWVEELKSSYEQSPELVEAISSLT